MSEDGNTNVNETKNDPVTISAPPAAAVTIDPQNPLPEPSFFWRRWIAILICANALVFAWFAAAWLVGGEQWDDLYGLTKLLIYFAGLVLTYYFIAPSASELTNMIQSANLMKKSLDVAETASKSAAGAAQSYAQRRFEGDVAPDSRNPAPALSEAPRGSGGPSADSGEIDAAPRGRP
jgi:hypothetical protein